MRIARGQLMRRWWNIRRFDVIELIVISAVLAGVTLLIALRLAIPDPHPESVSLAGTFGPSRNSEHEEEWIIRDFFKDRRDGVFVDVGANHYRTFSNTYYLDIELGWSGLAIDPQYQFADDYRKHRPRTRFLPFFVSDVSNQEATMYFVANNTLVTSSSKSFTERFGKDAKAFKAPTSTLDDLLDHEKVTALDFLTMDIELAEPQALKGFDIERFRPALVCIEAHPEVRQRILDYFASHGYVVAGKYLRIDAANLYFTPLSTEPG